MESMNGSGRRTHRNWLRFSGWLIKAAQPFKQTNISDPIYISILVGLASAAAIAGIVLRDAPNDELLSFYFSRPDIALATVVKTWKASTHIPTYYAVLRAWNEVFGAGRISSRLLSLLGLPLVAYLIYPYRKFMSLRHFRIFSALLLLSPAVVYYAGDARMYIFLLAGTAAVFHFGFQIFDVPECRRTRSLVAFALSAILLSMIDYFGLIFAVATVAVLLVRFFSVHRVIRLPLLLLLLTISVIPAAWTYFAWSGLGPQTDGRGWLHFQPIESVHQFASLLFSRNFPLPLAALAGLAFSFRRIAHPLLIGFALAVAIVGYGIGFVFSLNTPVLMGHTLLVFAVPTLVVVGAGVDAAMSAAIDAWPQWKDLVLPVVATLITVNFFGAIHGVYVDKEDFAGPSRFVVKAGCANAEILTNRIDADVPGTQGAFVMDYYFLHVLRVPSPRFMVYTRRPMTTREAPRSCPVKAFVWQYDVDPGTIWRVAQTELGASPVYREIRFANTYLLVDSADK